jgi:hypothetical protein
MVGLNLAFLVFVLGLLTSTMVMTISIIRVIVNLLGVSDNV